MKKTKIDWADSTWNPVTGCLHDCPYCYARGIARRFGGCADPEAAKEACRVLDSGNFLDLYELGQPLRALHCERGEESRPAPYPFCFAPTFHRYRLGEPARWTRPRNIFVCSMADLFGDWVPEAWIKDVFAACQAAPWHRYLFLTKNPKRYLELYRAKAFPYSDNIWLGSTVTGPDDEYVWVRDTPYHSFVSAEPLLKPLGNLAPDIMPEWLIVGAETGRRKDKVLPEKQWILDIADMCEETGVPLFMKGSFPEAAQLGDITKIDGGAIPPVDIISGGSPCQDLSIAGKRAGLEGERSGLFMDQMRIVRQMHKATGGKQPRYMIWENVPGAFSSNEGGDFHAILDEIVYTADTSRGGCGDNIPRPAGWRNAGAILGDGFSVAWRVLDAQFWGVPQRRRRIFLVADFRGV